MDAVEQQEPGAPRPELLHGADARGRLCALRARSLPRWFVSGPKYPHTPFHDTLVDYTRFPRVDEARFYDDALNATKDAIKDVTADREADIWTYLNAIRSDLIYGYGDPATSDSFGRATINLLDSAILRLRNGGVVPASLSPKDHSPLARPGDRRARRATAAASPYPWAAE